MVFAITVVPITAKKNSADREGRVRNDMELANWMGESSTQPQCGGRAFSLGHARHHSQGFGFGGPEPHINRLVARPLTLVSAASRGFQLCSSIRFIQASSTWATAASRRAARDTTALLAALAGMAVPWGAPMPPDGMSVPTGAAVLLAAALSPMQTCGGKGGPEMADQAGADAAAGRQPGRAVPCCGMAHHNDTMALLSQRCGGGEQGKGWAG